MRVRVPLTSVSVQGNIFVKITKDPKTAAVISMTGGTLKSGPPDVELLGGSSSICATVNVHHEVGSIIVEGGGTLRVEAEVLSTATVDYGSIAYLQTLKGSEVIATSGGVLGVGTIPAGTSMSLSVSDYAKIFVRENLGAFNSQSQSTGGKAVIESGHGANQAALEALRRGEVQNVFIAHLC